MYTLSKLLTPYGDKIKKSGTSTSSLPPVHETEEEEKHQNWSGVFDGPVQEPEEKKELEPEPDRSELMYRPGSLEAINGIRMKSPS